MWKTRIRPVATDDSDVFDGVDDIAAGGSALAGRRRTPRVLPLALDDDETASGQFRRKPRTGSNALGKSHDTQYMSSKSWRSQLTIVHTVKSMLCDIASLKLAAPFVGAGLVLAAAGEILALNQRYNFVAILVLAVAMKFPHFPRGTVRGQLCTSAFALLTFALDAYILATRYTSFSVPVRTLLVLVSACKLVVFYAFLHNIVAAHRTRKYLDRRLRLFLLPCHAPRRIMRDVRGRLLAVGGLHVMLLVAYGAFLGVSAARFAYSSVATQLTSFLAAKLLTTLLVLGGTWYDADVTLCLWYFGCCAFRAGAVRTHIRRTVDTLGGYPLAFSFHPTRFQLLLLTKALDVACGAYGWTVLGLSFGRKFVSLDQATQVLLSFLAFTLAVGDVYCLLLLLAVQWLWRRQKLLAKLRMLPASDDSELDDFRLRPAGAAARNPLHEEAITGDEGNTDDDGEEGTEGVAREVEHKADAHETRALLSEERRPAAAVSAPADAPPPQLLAFVRRFRREDADRQDVEQQLGYDVFSATSRSRAALPEAARSAGTAVVVPAPPRGPARVRYKVADEKEAAKRGERSSSSSEDLEVGATGAYVWDYRQGRR